MIRAASAGAVTAPLRGGLLVQQIKIAWWNADGLLPVGLLLAYPLGQCHRQKARTRNDRPTEATGKILR